MFKNREQAGKILAEKLITYKNCSDAIVIALPRGGVPVGFIIANALHLPLDITCPRKIGAPFNEEYAIGAITETGEGEFDEEALQLYPISQAYIDKKIAQEVQEAKRRLQFFRDALPPREIENKIVILVDDGLATGSTMTAAITSMKAEGADKIVLAVPVAPPETLDKMQDLVDEVICLETPASFQAVSQFYEEFGQTAEEEVKELLRKNREQE